MDILAFGAGVSLFITILAFALAFSGSASAQIRSRLEGAMSGTSVIESGSSPVGAALRETKSAGSLVKFVMSGAWLEKLQRDLALAESQLQPSDFIAIRLALAALGFAAPYLVLAGSLGSGFAMIFALIVAIVGLMLPQYWMSWRQNQRRKKLDKQLPDALIYVSNSLKAGFGLLQGLSMAAEQLQHPIATELEQTVHETNVGSSMDEAFLALSARCDSYDLDLVVTAVLIQRAAGGNLSEILENVAETMRERSRIKAEIQTLTAQQQLTGIVIALLPVGVGAMFLVVSPEYITPLFTDILGRVMLGAAIVLETLGVVIIKRILAIEV